MQKNQKNMLLEHEKIRKTEAHRLSQEKGILKQSKVILLLEKCGILF